MTASDINAVADELRALGQRIPGNSEHAASELDNTKSMHEWECRQGRGWTNEVPSISCLSGRPPNIRPYEIRPAITVIRLHRPLSRKIVDFLWMLLVWVTGH